MTEITHSRDRNHRAQATQFSTLSWCRHELPGNLRAAVGPRDGRNMSLEPRDAAVRLAAVSRDLEAAGTDPASIMAAATSSLSRIKPATWVGVVMNPNPDTCRVVVANEADQAMADWVDDYVAAIDRPNRAPTIGISQQVIASGEPIVVSSLPYEEFLALLSPAGQAFSRTNPPPRQAPAVAYLIVPMQVGGATIGTLAMFDWKRDNVVVHEDLRWVQPVADRIALSLEHGRLLRTVRADTKRTELVRSLAMASRHGQDLRATLAGIVELVKGQPLVDAAEMLLMRSEGDDLIVVASAGFRSPCPPEHRIPVTAARRSTDGSHPRVELLVELEVGGPRRFQFAREGFVTFVHVPLHARNRLVGVLELYSRSVVEWEEESLDFFDTLSGLLGAAIDHAAAPTPAHKFGKMAGSGRPDLSQLELEILRLLGDGLTNLEIGDQVHRSADTIKFHVRRLLDKSGAVNRTQLASRAWQEGWL